MKKFKRKNILIINFIIIMVLMVVSGCMKKENASISFMEYIVKEDKISLANMPWGITLEEASPIIGELDETKPESNVDPYVTRKWPKEKLIIEEFDITAEYMVYFFDEDDGFYSAWIWFNIGDYEDTLKIYENIKSYLLDNLHDNFRFMESNSVGARNNEGNYHINLQSSWRNPDDIMASLVVEIEPHQDNSYGVYLKISKERPYREEREEKVETRFSEKEIKAAKEAARQYIEKENADNSDIVKIIIGIVYDGDYSIENKKFYRNYEELLEVDSDNIIILRAAMYIVDSENIKLDSFHRIVLLRDDIGTEWYINDQVNLE